MMEKFKRANGIYYAWYEVEASFLETLVPEAAPYLPKDKEGNVIPTKLKDYLITYTLSLDGNSAVMLLSAKQESFGRLSGTLGEDLQLWANFLPAFGKPFEAAMTTEEARALLHSPKYRVERDGRGV